MNRISKTVAVIGLCLMGLAGCSSAAVKEEADQELIRYEEVANADTTTIKNGDLEYVPFSAADKSQIGKKIGTFTFSGDDQEESVYELNGQPSDKWIITTDDAGQNAMIYREMDVKDYPDGFVSEYPWN